MIKNADVNLLKKTNEEKNKMEKNKNVKWITLKKRQEKSLEEK